MATQSVLERVQGRKVGVVLSAGYFGFYGHAGFVEALTEAGIRPVAWAGTSAGGLIGAFAAAGLTPAVISARVLAQKREDFWDPDFAGIASAVLRSGSGATGLLKGGRFRQLIERNLPHPHFEALPTPLVLVATHLTAQRAHVMTTGALVSAIHATCAYPGLFQAVERDGALLWDGGIVDKAPAVALSEHVAGLESLIVHYLPSRDDAKPPSGAFAYAQGMAAGFAAVRREHFRLQLEVLRGRGVHVEVITSRLPPVSPKEMHRGAEALATAKQLVTRALREPSKPWGGED